MVNVKLSEAQSTLLTRKLLSNETYCLVAEYVPWIESIGINSEDVLYVVIRHGFSRAIWRWRDDDPAWVEGARATSEEITACDPIIIKFEVDPDFVGPVEPLFDKSDLQTNLPPSCRMANSWGAEAWAADRKAGRLDD